MYEAHHPQIVFFGNHKQYKSNKATEWSDTMSLSEVLYRRVLDQGKACHLLF